MVARSRGPCYKLTELIKACKNKGRVFVRKQARVDAKKFFNLETDLKILTFVATGVFEDLEHESTNELDSVLTKESLLMRISSGLDLLNTFILPFTKGEMARGSSNHFIPLKLAEKSLFIFHSSL